MTAWRDDRSLPGTIALTAVTLSVAVGFGRLFADGSFLAPVLLAAFTGHGVAWWCRRNGLPTGPAGVASLGAVGLIAAWTVLGHTTAYGVPLPLTIRVAVDTLASARGVFSTVKAPADVLPGFLLATILALGIAAFMADWAAFRLQATFEAIIPSFTLFLFTAALGNGRHRTWAVAVFVAAVLAFLVVHGLARSSRATAWFGGQPASGPGTLLRTAALIGAVALGAALLVGPRLPAPDSAVIKYKNRTGTGPSNRATISPLVDIRGRLVEQAGIEVFTVESPVKAYWRLTSLDTFDGTIWSSNDTYRPTRGRIETGEVLRPGLPSTVAEQRFSITGLASIWLPSAFRPSVVTEVPDVSYNRDTASLITPAETTDGLAYRVRSQVPVLTPELLGGVAAEAPPEIIEQYLALPPISARVRAEAERIVAGARTPYERARALQDHFLRGFRYDLNAPPGHDETALENFLLRTRRGYCEQFSGAYAVLARAVGLPARVAVGFTPGELLNGVYHVRDQHAHAWPEVYLHGFGWVAFEPTPGRGAPNASAYTGRPEAQDESGNLGGGTSVPTTAAVTDSAETPTSAPDLSGADQANPPTDTTDDGFPAILTVLLALLSLAAVWAIVVPALHLRRRRQRRAVPGVAAQVLADWADTAEVLAAAGVSRRSSETMAEYAARASASAGLQADPSRALRTLAQDASLAAYAEGDVAGEVASRSAAAARAVHTAVFDQVPVADRVRWWLDPRTVR